MFSLGKRSFFWRVVDYGLLNAQTNTTPWRKSRKKCNRFPLIYVPPSSTVIKLNGLKCISPLSPQSTFTCRQTVWSSLSCRQLLISTPGYECPSSKPPGLSFSMALGKMWTTYCLTSHRDCLMTHHRLLLIPGLLEPTLVLRIK